MLVLNPIVLIHILVISSQKRRHPNFSNPAVNPGDIMTKLTKTATKATTRPGVEASIRLHTSTLQNPQSKTKTWETIESQYKEMLSKKSKKLLDLDDFCDTLSTTVRKQEKPFLNEEDFFQVIEWKFNKGKPRYALMKHLKSNGAGFIRACSEKGFEKASEGKIREALDEFCKLKGVGPATASAFLGLFRPDLFCFMDDVVIECLHEGKRDYTMKIYLEVNAKCEGLAKSLGEGWNCERVGRALWTAARISHEGLPDLTKDDAAEAGGDAETEKKENNGQAENDIKAEKDTETDKTEKRNVQDEKKTIPVSKLTEGKNLRRSKRQKRTVQ